VKLTTNVQLVPRPRKQSQLKLYFLDDSKEISFQLPGSGKNTGKAAHVLIKYHAVKTYV
jgi:hypothetical protein